MWSVRYLWDMKVMLDVCTWLRLLKGALQDLRVAAPVYRGDTAYEMMQRSPNPT